MSNQRLKLRIRASVFLLGLFVGAGVTAAADPPQQAPSLAFKLPRASVGEGLVLEALSEEKVGRETAFALKGQPQRYAISHAVAVEAKSSVNGRWQDVGTGMRLWRLRIDAPGALSIDVAFKPFHLPKGAALYLTDSSGRFVRGPYTDADNTASGEFWTPFVPGDVAFVEVLLPAKAEKQLQLELFNVNQAFRDIFTGEALYAKSGSCNVDVICPQGDTHREQIRAVARYSVGGGLCSGQLINNTANDGKRLFITANHCLSSQASANSVVAYWNYENPTCRTPGSASSGNPISVSGNSIAQSGGATLRATHQPSDTTLFELNTSIPAGVTPFWDGWDRSETSKSSAVVIHHPQGDEKRISFENNPLLLSDVSIQGVPGSRHWRVNDWDLGTTEQGSSGSGLLSPEKRLIGVLSGGAAACGNNAEDYFGRLSVAWDGGGTSSTRVRDWLDPGSSGAVTLDGRGACTPPTVSVTSNAPSLSVDAAITFTATIAGGAAPYTVRWDVDGDGVVDRTTTTNTNSASIPVRYPVASSLSVTATASDASVCPGSGSLAINVSAPDITAQAGTKVQVCGDGDSVIEPGERWQLPVTLTNVGGNGLNNAIAQFARDADSGSPSAISTDQFGNRLFDSSSASCRFQSIDMSGAATVATDEIDDGVSGALALGGAGPFRLYGQNVSQLYMSTNGYLATSAQDDGADFDNVCDGFGSTFASNARLHVLHDDLVVQSGGNLRHQHFATCPRNADVGAAQGCTVFQWNNLGRFTSNSTPPSGNAVFQAILYDQSHEIVYQYLTADPLAGGGATISIENAARSDRSTYGCNTSSQAPAGRAVCFFEPSAVPTGAQSAAISLEGAAQQPLPNLASSQSAVVNVPFSVPTSATCGQTVAMKYVGTVDDVSSSRRAASVLTDTIGSGGNCQISNACPISTTPLAGIPKGGLYWNPNRSGNGIGMFNIAVGNSAVMAGTWFSGRADRSPTWYLINGAWQSNDRLADLTFFRFAQTAPGTFPAVGTQVGTGVLTHDGSGDDYVMSWSIDGVQRMDKLVRTFADSNVGQTNHTGLWNTQGQSGWGVLVDDHAFGATLDSYMVNYLYDNTGQPTWTLGSANNLSGTMPQQVFQVHCPWCPNITDFAATTVNTAGSQTRTFNDASNGIFGSTIQVPITNTTWNRSNLPIRLLTTPL
jgi:lysyl endopeptidase